MTKKLFCLLLSVLFVSFASACDVSEATIDDNSEITATTGGDDVFFAKKEVSESYTLTDEAITNPFMGFAPDARSKGAAEKCSLVYVDITFKELQPKNENEFDFATIEKENHLAMWKKAGKHVVLRFVCDQPEDDAHMDIPDWLYDKIDGAGTAYDISYGKGFSPDYNNETFISYHEKAIEALGEHFGQDTFVSYVELGSLGHWGEWHVKYEDGIDRLPLAAVREKYVTPYISAFPNAKILMRRPFAVAAENGFGVFNDMAGEPDATEEWLDWIENGGDFNQTKETDALVAMPDAWQSAPIGGEMNSYLSMDAMCKTDLPQTTSLISTSHTTFLGPKCPISGSDKYDDTLYLKAVKELTKSMGYRLGITKLEISKTNKEGIAKIDITWTNEGVAPIYFDLPVKLYITDSGDNIQTTSDVEIALSEIQPGKTVKTSTRVELGTSHSGKSVYLGIIDELTGNPAVLLTNEFEIKDNMNKLYTFS